MDSLLFSQLSRVEYAQPISCELLSCVREALEKTPEKESPIGSKWWWGSCDRRVTVTEFVATSGAHVISTLRDNASRLASQVGAREEVLREIEIAVGEALTNAYKHGSPKERTSVIIMRCAVCDRAFAVEIRDEGPPFDPNVAIEPDPHSLREDGMGIYLMRCMMDVVEFESNLPGNRVRMIKWLCP